MCRCEKLLYKTLEINNILKWYQIAEPACKSIATDINLAGNPSISQNILMVHGYNIYFHTG